MSVSLLLSSTSFRTALSSCSRTGYHGLGCHARNFLVFAFRPASSATPARLKLFRTDSRPPSVIVRHVHSTASATSQSILGFIANRVCNATHRSRISRVSSNSPRSGSRAPFPPPRGSQSAWEKFRATIERIPRPALLWGVLALNGAVFVAWHLAIAQYRSTGDPSAFIWMTNNFTASLANVNAGRIWTLVTCCFSHKDTMHLLFNSFTYYIMAPTVISILGNVSFLALYLGGGLVSSAASIFWTNAVKQRKAANYASHGASGAIYAIISFFACMAPTAQFFIFAVIPMPAWALVTGIFLWDSYSAIYEKRMGTDTAGHVGGILAGIGYYLRMRSRLF